MASMINKTIRAALERGVFAVYRALLVLDSVGAWSEKDETFCKSLCRQVRSRGGLNPRAKQGKKMSQFDWARKKVLQYVAGRKEDQPQIAFRSRAGDKLCRH